MAQPVRIADKTYGFDFLSLRSAGLNAERVFYYDCLNDVRKEDELDSDFAKRVEAHQAFFDRIQGLEGFHVRLGSISGARKKLRQKKVDVLLAVEALDHAFRGNMSRACLMAGNLDFAPLVDSLIRLGTYVQVIYSRRSAAKELYIAADIGQPITFNEVDNWSTRDFQKRHPIPSATANEQLLAGVAHSVVRSGKTNGSPISLYTSETLRS